MSGRAEKPSALSITMKFFVYNYFLEATMKFVKILSACLIIILLFGFILAQSLRKIEYLRATDGISLKFIEEYKDCLSAIRDFEYYYTKSFAEYLLSEKYIIHIGNLKKLLDEQAELNILHNIPFRTENEMFKLCLVRTLVIMRIYAEILAGNWEDTDIITINNKDISYSEFRINEVFSSEYKDNVRIYHLMTSKTLLEVTYGSLTMEQLEIERRVKSFGLVYLIMKIKEEPPILPQKYYDDQIRREFDLASLDELQLTDASGPMIVFNKSD